MDDQDRLWVAFFGEGEVRCIDASGAVVEVVEVPVPRPTCPEFAGPDLDILVIATALYRMNAEQRATSPDSGALYAVRPGVRGRPSTRWAGTTR
jgi:sugar lactone lactonase YvrE